MEHNKVEETKQEEIVLNEKQQEAVAKYLGSRFAVYGIKRYELKYELTPRFTCKAIFSQEIPKKFLGIFKHALKSCVFEAKVWTLSVQGLLLIQCHLAYEHINGGSNGCELDVELTVDKDAEICELNGRVY